MNLRAGKILISSELMEDPVFKNAILYITEYNDKGAVAFIINQIFERRLNELVEFSGSPAFPLYNGGPVDKEHLFFIHSRPDLIAGGEKITDAIYWGGDFKKAIGHINNKTLTATGIKIFIGYCGWGAGELEAEIEEGSWKISESNIGIVFA